MELRAIARQNMFITVSQFGQDNAPDFAGNADAVEKFAVITGVIENLRQHAATQTSGAVGRTTVQKSVLRDAIRTKLKEIARTARALGIDNAGLHRLFSVPDNNGDTKLIAAAREFAAEATKFKADFLRLAMPADFIEDLTADIESFEQS